MRHARSWVEVSCSFWVVVPCTIGWRLWPIVVGMESKVEQLV